MKFNKVNSVLPPGQEQFVCFEYCPDKGTDDIDALFLGSGNGRVYVYPIHKIAFARSLHPEDISAESPHGGPVTCLLFLPARSWVSSSEAVRGGNPSPTAAGQLVTSGDSDPPLLVSGGMDRTVKIWMPRSRNGSHYVQTLYGHEGKLSCLANGHDGSFLSCASDGVLKIWSPQRGRQLMRLPFFECSFSMNSTSRCWLTAMLVNHVGVWTCIVGDSSGTLEVYRKSLQGEQRELGFEARVATFNGAILRYKRWEKVHSLGVVQIVLAHDQKFVISLSSDGTAKIVDIALGAVFFSVSNPRKCIYTGVLWLPSKMQFCLSDELGQVELWSLLLERRINECSLVVCHDKATTKAIIHTHRGPLLGALAVHKDPANFLALHPRSGHVTVWKMGEETTCVQYLDQASSETCMVIGFGVPPLRGHLKSPPHSGDSRITGASPIVGSVASILQAVQSGTPGLGATPFSTSSPDKKGVQHESLLPEENSFFTIDQEGMCRCWDEYDKTERYAFRVKGTQVSCMKFVWGMNCLAIGHRNGQLSFWNLDSGLRFTSHKQLQTVSCMEIAKAKKCDVLIVTDFSGNIMMMNLSLFKINPLQISIDATFPGYHDADEPAVLSLAFHDSTGVVFSGGDDRSIRYWRLPKDVDFRTLEQHPGAVCCLFTTEHLLISGDEEGRVNVWSVVSASRDRAVSGKADIAEAGSDVYSTRRSTLPVVHLVGCWNLGPYAAIRSISAEEVLTGVYISFISRLNRTTVRFLSFVHNSSLQSIHDPVDTLTEPLQVTGSPMGRGLIPEPPESSSGPPSRSDPRRQVRQTSTASEQGSDENVKRACSGEAYSITSVNWTGLLLRDATENTRTADIEFGGEQAVRETTEEGNRGFIPSALFSYVECKDINDFQFSMLGKEPASVHMRCDGDKGVCYTYVGTENGSIYKYTSDM